MKRLCNLVVIVCLCSTASHAASLEKQLSPLLDAHEGKVTVAIRHFETGEEFSRNAETPMPTASLIKFPVMVEAYRQAAKGEVDLNAPITLRETDKVPGSGILTSHFSPGLQLPLRDSIRLMMRYSDNTATNLVLDQIGLKSVSDTMDGFGLANTKIHAKVYRRDTSVFPERSKEFGLGSTTARETIQLYEMLYRGELGSKESTKEMLAHLEACEDKTKLASLLPHGSKIKHKGGAVSRVRCDAGIIEGPSGAFAICVMTSDNKDRSWRDDNAAHQLIGGVARIAYDHFNGVSDVQQPIASQELVAGASGELVEALQRTLNARLNPSPELSVDGDFGPITQAAVVRFQHEREIEANGIVTETTWKALGPLLMKDAPVPSPDIVNNEVASREPEDTLDGMPFVTCDAWVIGDGSNGEALWGSRGDEPRGIASTTKIMTAFVVLSLAESNPEVLDEIVTFSTRADETLGSTAGIRAGEKLSVRELLYGLLLPSGNDASVALAEHFGSRFQTAKDAKEDDAYSRFIAQMNRTAADLGMSHTTYKNPHGLTEPGHVASASDLLRLAHAAMKLESFRRYVGTIQRGCTVSGASGYRRNVVWRNTNQLLKTTGYEGIKTGTTTAAGACLVSYSVRDGKQLIAVVLGSKSSPARYTDTRNLFRWAWNNLP